MKFFAASDIDGTVLMRGEKHISSQLLDLIGPMYEKEVLFCAASGRSYHDLRRLFEKTADNMLFICHDGALVMFRGQLLFKSCIDRNYAAEYTEKVRRHNNVNIMLSGQYITYIIPCEERFRDKMYDMFHNHVVEVQSFSEIDDDIYKIGFYSFDSADSLVLPECDFSQMYLAYSENNWKEFIRSGVNKGQAVKFAMNFFNIPADNSIAFGDNYNDIEMLQSVKYGFAVKNCKFEIEKVCENTTDSVESTLRKVFFTN